MYTALEIARYIINKCIQLGRPVSNLQLQKILYYVQGEYMKNNDGTELFEEEIVAWQYGPVVPEVYYNFNIYSSSVITTKQPDVDLKIDDRELIDPIIDGKSKFSAWSLVQKTHSEAPWKDNYEDGKNNVISKISLRMFFM